MSVAANGVYEKGRLQRLRNDLEASGRRVRVIKIACGLLLGILFWFSVPYRFPFLVERYPEKAITAESAQSEGNLTRQMAVPLIALIGLFLYKRLPHRGKLRGTLCFVVLCYIGWVWISLGWSEDRAITAKRLIVFSMDAWFAYAVARVFSIYEMALLGVAQPLVVALIALYGDLVYQRIFAFSDPDYRFQGVTEANYQAMSLVVCIFSAVTLLDRKPKWAKVLVPVTLCALVLLYLTRSRVSTIICLLFLTVMGVRLAKHRLQPATRAVAMLTLLAVVLPSAVYFVGYKGAGAAQSAFMMGRTDTENTSNLSNRAPLWSELWQYVKEKPVLGTGYDAFWTGDHVYRISIHQGWAVPHAHEGYLDQTLSIGVIGALLYMVSLWGAGVVAWRRYLRSRDAGDLLPAVLLTWVAMESMAESVPLDPYLPSMLAYACIVKMCMMEGSEAAADVWLEPDEVVGGLAPGAFDRWPAQAREEAAMLLGGSK